MALVWSAVLDRHIARTSVAQRRQLTGLSAGSSLSQPRGIRRPLGSFSETPRLPVTRRRGLRSLLSSSPPRPRTARGDEDTPSMRLGLAALGRVVTASQTELAHRSFGPAHQAGGGPTH